MPVVAAARFVVSDIGDILSPKKAPETIAPTIRGAGTPMLMPTPYRATPMVAMRQTDTASSTIASSKNKMTLESCLSKTVAMLQYMKSSKKYRTGKHKNEILCKILVNHDLLTDC